MEEAFRGPGSEATVDTQALLSNLATVDPAAWRALPAGAARSIEAIALHVGACKVMHDDYAFGGATLLFDQVAVQRWAEGEAPFDETVGWLERVHRTLADHVAGLADDAELDRERLTNGVSFAPHGGSLRR